MSIGQRGVHAFLCGGMLAGALTFLPSVAVAQGLRVPPVQLAPLPGAETRQAFFEPHLPMDGGRVVLTTPGGGPIRVVDIRSGAVVFDSEPHQTATRDFADARLTPDGGFLVFTERDESRSEVWARELTSGIETRLSTGSAWMTLVSVSALAREAAVFEPSINGSPMSLAVEGPARPRVLAATPCGAEGNAAPAFLSADGRRLAHWWSGTEPTDPQDPGRRRLVITDLTTGQGTCLPAPEPALRLDPFGATVMASSDLRWVAYTAGRGYLQYPPAVVLVDTHTGAASPVVPGALRSFLLDVSDDGRVVLLTAQFPASEETQLLIVDRATGTRMRVVLPPDLADTTITPPFAALSGDGLTVVASARVTNAPPAGVSRVFIARLDADGDRLPDWWESAFGLDRSDATDASSDVDADGLTAAQEYAAGTHPAAAPVRYFAEGANNSFFATTLALFNPTDTALTANVRFLGPAGATVSSPVTLPARTPVRIVADDVGLPFTEFSMLLEAPGQIVAERRMTWDRATGYGSHASSGVEAPSTTWHFAEGATISGIQTFLLLQNPGTTPTAVTLRYLLSNGTTQERRHVVPALSRVTVWVNQEGAPMQAAEFATVVQADQPIVAERAVYRDVGAQVYGAGSAAAGVPAPLTEWSFAEGATGDFFDTYLLLANPSDQPVDATVRFVTDFDRNNLGPTLSPVIRTYSLAPRARLTLRIADQDPMLATRQVSSLVTSSAPIVAERAMWWPGPTAATWAESHADTGAGPTGTAWAVADLQSDTTPDGWDTFLLVNAPQSTGPLVRVRLACEDGATVDRTLALMPYRVTLWMRYDFPESVGRRCAATLESLPRKLTNSPTVQPNRAPMRVEKAMYSGAFSAGTATSGARLPDPIDPPS